MFTPSTLEAYKFFHAGTLALAHVERGGMCVDVEYCKSMLEHLAKRHQRGIKKFEESNLVKLWKETYRSKTNLDSNDQLADILYNHLKFEPIKFTATGKPSTDKEALAAVELPELQELLRVKNFKHIQDVLKSLLREEVHGIVHPVFNLNIPATYRPSTEAPNLANVPKRDPEAQKICRSAFIASPGHKIISADFKGVEVSVAACYHKDPAMIEYVTDSSKDMHRDMALKLFVLEMEDICDSIREPNGNIIWELNKKCKPVRQSGKNEWVFPQFYGDWWKSCAGYLFASSFKDTHMLKEGKRLIDHLKEHKLGTLQQFEKHCEKIERWMWDEKWPVYTQWKKDWWKDYQYNGYFDSYTGFRYSGALLNRKQACNYPIQGSAFHCLLQCLIWMVEDSIKENWKSRVVNQIYDDILLDVSPDEEKMVVNRLHMYMTERLPEYWEWIIVPLEVDISATEINGNWYSMKEIK